MSFVTGLVDHPLAQRVGWVLLHSIWQGAVAGAAFGLARHGLRRRSAQARYAAGCLALALLAAGPLATVVLWPALAPPGQSGLAAQGAAGLSALVSGPARAAASIGDGTDSLLRLGAEWCWRLSPWVAAAWALGVAVCVVRLLRGCLWARRIRSRQTETVGPAWVGVVDDLRLRLRISQPVRLLKSALVEVPTVIGWLRPVILLPAAALSGLAPEQLEAILAHELAHVRRFDYLVNACQCIIETLMFYHPAVWWISSCVREERENCCDDLVVQVCSNRVAYARALASLAESSTGLTGLAFAASGAPLLTRIRRLLGVEGETCAFTTRQLTGLGLLTLGLPLILAGVCLLLSTSSFRATARIRIDRDAADGATAPGTKDNAASYDPYFVQTEFEVLQSELILGKVVDDLGLREKWGKKYANGERLSPQEAVGLLKGHISLRPVRNARVVEIQVYSEKPQEAADLANAIALAYRQYRVQATTLRGKGAVAALIFQLKEKEAEVAAARTNLDFLRRTLKIPDSSAGEPTVGPLITAESLRQINVRRLEYEAELAQQNSLVERLNALTPDELTHALPTVVSGETLLPSLLEQKGFADQRRLELERDFGNDHPDVVKARVSQADLQTKIQARVQGIMKALDVKAQATAQGLNTFSNLVEEAKLEDIKKANESQSYFDAKRKLDELLTFRGMLETKIGLENVDLALPKTLMVTLIDYAVPARHPISPNRVLALTLIGSGLLLDLAGALLLRARPRPGLADTCGPTGRQNLAQG